MNIDETITITKKKYKELLDSELKLNCLENAGVDNWEWYDDAMERYHNNKEDAEYEF